MSLKNKEYRKLTEFEKQCTTFHTWVNFLRGRNPIISKREEQYVLFMMRVLADRYECQNFTGNIMDTHMHLVSRNGEGPREISRFWHALKTVIVNLAREKDMTGPIFANRAQFRAISDPQDLIVVTRYVNNNGINDGHIVKASFANELRYKQFELINPDDWEESTSLNPDEVNRLLFCPDEDLYRFMKPFLPRFRKKQYMFTVSGASSKVENLLLK